MPSSSGARASSSIAAAISCSHSRMAVFPSRVGGPTILGRSRPRLSSSHAPPERAWEGGDGVDVELVVTKGLGDNSFVIASGGDAAVIDPQRDAERFLSLAEARGWAVRHVLETHVHNDYVSGALEIRAATGAEVLGPVDAGYRFPFRALVEGDEVTVGDVRLVAMATPGHTPEHTAYLAFE